MKRPEALTAVDTAATTTTMTKIENAIEGLPHNCFNRLHDRVLCAGSKDKENALTIRNYITSLRSETNLSDNYRKVVVMLLCDLSMFFSACTSLI